MPPEVNSGLEGVVAAETTISLVDGQAGRLLYRGYEIGDLAAHGSYDRVVGLLLDGEWPPHDEVLPAAELSPTVLAALRGLPTSCAPLDALRTAFSAFGAERRMDWPPT
ncbi:MAG TPA: citrate/2-methylcitrate synthase, partial [Gaiellales bacterium]|nr:citrate/2-methylcitrate synthase [Gaiellales bacterium]